MVNKKDASILSELRKNSRQTLVNISKNTKIPVSTVYDRIKLNEKDTIKKHTSILDFPKLGYNIRAHIIISAEEKKDLEEFLLKNNNVNSAFKLSNYAFSIDCIFKYMSEMEEFIELLEQFKITSKNIYLISDELKREEFLINMN